MNDWPDISGNARHATVGDVVIACRFLKLRELRRVWRKQAKSATRRLRKRIRERREAQADFGKALAWVRSDEARAWLAPRGVDIGDGVTVPLSHPRLWPETREALVRQCLATRGVT